MAGAPIADASMAGSVPLKRLGCAGAAGFFALLLNARAGGAGLVDIVMPYPRGIEPSPEDDMVAGIAEFANLLRGTGVPQWPSLGSYADHNLSLYDYRCRAHRFLAAGADGVSRWDTDTWLARVGLNNPEVQRLWVEEYLPPEENIVVSTAGLNRTIFSPRHGV